jgi:uncharacterized membrane protein
MTDQVTDQVGNVSDKAEDATENATDGAGTFRDQTLGAFTSAARDILGPAIQQMSQQAAKQAAEYVKDQGPKLVKEQVLPQVMKATGADNPGDLAKQGVGKVGDTISDAGGVTGIAGKMMSKVGSKDDSATGYGEKRRMPVQQDVFVSVNIKDAYRGWTEYSRWTEFMFRASQVEPQEDDEGSIQVKITEKMWGFSRPFTAEVESQKPCEHIRWKTTDGTEHAGMIAFHKLADKLTFISVTVDHAPSGVIEKIARGARFDKRAIRSDLHRFKGWIEFQSEEEMEEIEGWMGTVEDGQITITHDEAMGEENGQEGDAGQDEAREGEEQNVRGAGKREQEDAEGGEEDREEGVEDDQEVEKPLPRPKARSGGTRKRRTERKTDNGTTRKRDKTTA